MKPDYPLPFCPGCKKPLLDRIEPMVCVAPNVYQRGTIRICPPCKRGWIWNVTIKFWVELQKVKEGELNEEGH